ncbi:MAG: HesA/MoeB/ThiF family protein [Anaerolineae bacterium]|jgi:molybdopterin/thiamine biosynthesis adenylyltransferase
MDESAAELLSATLQQSAVEVQGRPTLSLEAAKAAQERFGLSRRQVELAALEAGVAPLRYLRNIGTIGLAGQAALLRSTVAVVGLGGLGGYNLEGLARSGVGHIIAVDSDRFEEHNLNRQALSSEHNLGQPKAEAARARVAAINGAVEVTARQARLTAESAADLLAGADVIVDALDNLTDRLALQDAAAALGKPLVHGAIAGFMGQVMVILPGDRGLKALYPEGQAPERGLEQTTGTPAATPMLVAALQVQETVKLLTGVGEPLRHRLLILDCENGEVQTLDCRGAW